MVRQLTQVNKAKRSLKTKDIPVELSDVDERSSEEEPVSKRSKKTVQSEKSLSTSSREKVFRLQPVTNIILMYFL